MMTFLKVGCNHNVAETECLGLLVIGLCLGCSDSGAG